MSDHYTTPFADSVNSRAIVQASPANPAGTAGEVLPELYHAMNSDGWRC